MPALLEVVAFPCLLCDTDLVDPEEKLFLDSSATDEVLLGIKERPGEDVFLAGGGGVFRLLVTGDFSFKMDEIVFSVELLSGVFSLRTGKFLSTEELSIGDWERLNKGFLLNSSIMSGDLDRSRLDPNAKLDRFGDLDLSL